MYKKIIDRYDAIKAFRDKGVVRGETTGFSCLDELYSVKQGTFTIYYAEPTHGKSELIFENCINQAERHNKRSLICSPETGTVDEIIAELIHKYTGKQIFKSAGYAMSEKELAYVMDWLSNYFVIVDTDERAYSIPELFALAEQWEKENPGQKIDIIVGEPYNELNHDDMVKFGSRQDLYIEDLMSQVRRLCRKNNKHFMLSIHPSGSAVPVTKKKFTYYPKPLPRQAAGGQALYRKSMTWITLWRPPKGLTDSAGWEYKENEVHVFVDKAKPKGVSFKGMIKLYFNWKRNRYYEIINGNDCYAFDHLDPAKTSFINKPMEQPENHHAKMLAAKQAQMELQPISSDESDPF